MKATMICFMGLDGSGKTSCIEHIHSQLRARGIRAEIVRAAYVIRWLRGPIRLAKRLLMQKDSDPFAGDYTAYLKSLRRQAGRGGVYKIFSLLTSAEFHLQIFFNIRLKRLTCEVLLVDRYIYDNAVTHAANLGRGAECMRTILRDRWRHAPRPDRIIYIKTPVETCLSRKDDIPDPLYLRLREPLYDKMAEICGAAVISGDQAMESMLRQAMDEVECILRKGNGRQI